MKLLSHFGFHFGFALKLLCSAFSEFLGHRDTSLYRHASISLDCLAIYSKENFKRLHPMEPSTYESLNRRHFPFVPVCRKLSLRGGEGGKSKKIHKLSLEDILDGDFGLNGAEERNTTDTELFDYKEGYRRLIVEVEGLRAELRARSTNASAEQAAEATSDPSIEINRGNSPAKIKDTEDPDSMHASASTFNIRELAKYIPLRLNPFERNLLRLLEAALTVSEYVDRVDILSTKPRAQRCAAMIREACALLCGLLIASDYKAGQALVDGKDYASNAAFFRRVFEIGRRHKMMNPEKMRSAYGKLIYLMQDAQAPEVADLLGFQCKARVTTVAAVLHEYGLEALLDDPLVPLATAEVDSEGRTREQVHRAVRAKEAAVATLVKRYGGISGGGGGGFADGGGAADAEQRETLGDERVRQCLYSMADHAAFLRAFRGPVDHMLEWLRARFRPDLRRGGVGGGGGGGGGGDGDDESWMSLAIQGGRDGARLTHSHRRQYRYVEQTLVLWQEVLGSFLHLWHAADADLLDPRARYRLRGTGQGLQRVQEAGRVGAVMHKVVERVMARVGGGGGGGEGEGWVGSCVVHLGDENVPNALVFIDKYTQVERILSPLVLSLSQLPKLCAADGHVGEYIRSAFGGPERLQNMILADFFRGGFDGSGADNFFSAGSCIDGRLTSAWNWCSLIAKKPFYPALLLTGFTGFDGKFD